MTRVVGVVLVRDEDLFVERAVRNVSKLNKYAQGDEVTVAAVGSFGADA